MSLVLVDGWSVSAQYRKCGKAKCKACAEGQGHGPYYYGTRVADGKKEIRYFGRKLPDQEPTIQPDIQEDKATTPLSIDDHIQAIVSALGDKQMVGFYAVRRDILADLYVGHTTMWQLVKETRGQQTVRRVDRTNYVLPSDYVVHIGKNVMHLQGIEPGGVSFVYWPQQAEIRMDIHHQGGTDKFFFRGMDVVKMALWLSEHTRGIQDKL